MLTYMDSCLIERALAFSKEARTQDQQHFIDKRLLGSGAAEALDIGILDYEDRAHEPANYNGGRMDKSKLQLAAAFAVGGFLFYSLASAGSESSPTNRYCSEATGSHPSWWDRTFNGKQVTLGGVLANARCMELSENNLLYAPCEIKQAWFVERHRHEDAQQDIKDKSLGKYAMGISADPVHRAMVAKSRAAELAQVCEFTGSEGT